MILSKTLAEMAESPALADLLAYEQGGRNQRFRQAGISWLARRGLDADEGDIALCAGAHNGLVATFATVL
jgi:DNA-binding transcriptional MocR family regulator